MVATPPPVDRSTKTACEPQPERRLEGGGFIDIYAVVFHSAVGVTNQRETTLVWDKETGEPLYNAIGLCITHHNEQVSVPNTLIYMFVVLRCTNSKCGRWKVPGGEADALPWFLLFAAGSLVPNGFVPVS